MQVVKPLSEMDSIEMARWVGHTNYRRPGSIYMPELQVAYLIRCLRRESTGYDDNGKGKLRRHVLLIGPPDTTKSQCVEDFLTEFWCARHYSELDATQRSMLKASPTYTNLNGGVTWEAMRGGCNDGVIYKPQLHDCDFLFASELFSFLGHTPASMLHKVDQFNPALQEGWVEVNLAKMKGLPKKVKEAFAEEIEQEIEEGIIEYDAEDGIMRYHCNAAFIGCTRFLTVEQEERLKPTGFLSRLSIAEWAPDQDELRAYFDNQFGQRDEVVADALKKFNKYAWNADYIHVNYPPLWMVDKIIHYFNQVYWRVSQRTGHSFQEIRPGRDRQNVAQMLTAVAVSRELKKQMDEGVPIAKIRKIEYEPEDVDRVIAMREYQLDTLIRRKEDNAKDATVLAKATTALRRFVQKNIKVNVKETDLPETYEVIDGRDFVLFCVSEMGISEQTAYRWRGVLRDSAYLFGRGRSGAAGKDTGTFAVSPAIMEDMGLRSSHQAHAEQLKAMADAGVFEDAQNMEHAEEIQDDPYDEYYGAETL